MRVEPYLFFNGRCEEALEFYKKAIGIETVRILRFKDSPEPAQPGMVPPGSENKIMHCAFRIGESTILASDGRCQGAQKYDGFALTINVATEAEANRLFAGLSEGGQVHMPLTKTFFSPRFGMVADKFGMTWMIIVGV
jgi:PhnB protein